MDITKIRETIEKLKEEQVIDREQLAGWLSDYIDCRNELCWRCRRFKINYLGSCDGCKFEA